MFCEKILTVIDIVYSYAASHDAASGSDRSLICEMHCAISFLGLFLFLLDGGMLRYIFCKNLKSQQKLEYVWESSCVVDLPAPFLSVPSRRVLKFAFDVVLYRHLCYSSTVSILSHTLQRVCSDFTCILWKHS